LHFPAKELLPGTIDDFIAQRIEHYREMMALEQNPITNEKYSMAIRALARAPRLIDKLQDACLNKKMEFANRMFASSSGMVPPPSWDIELDIEIQEYEWLLVQLGKSL
jgi:hypothetical protein